jgi:glutamyl-tRNA synthetase
LKPFPVERVERDAAAAAKHLSGPDIASHLAAWRDQLRDLPSFDAAALEAALRALTEARGIKAGVLIHATRVAVTGQAASPGLFEVLELVGRERVLARIDDVLQGSPA